MIDKNDIYEQEYLQHERNKERRKMALMDLSHQGNEVVFEINWNSFVKKKGMIKITVGDKNAVVSREQLWAILFMFGSAEEQEKLVSPFMKHTRVTKFQKMIGVTTTHDITKGRLINIPLEITYNPESNRITIGRGSSQKLKRSVLTNG